MLTYSRDKNIDLLRLNAFNDLKAIGDGVLTVDNTVKNLSTLIAGINKSGTGTPTAAYFYVTSDVTGPAFRYTISGNNPVAGSIGIAKVNGDEFLITEFHNLEKFRVIQETDGNTSIYVTFLK